MEHDGRLIKLQVKSSTYKNHKKKNYNSGYTFSINRRSRITKNNKVYKIAFFHTKQIDVKYRKVIHPHQFEEYPIEKALEYME